MSNAEKPFIPRPFDQEDEEVVATQQGAAQSSVGGTPIIVPPAKPVSIFAQFVEMGYSPIPRYKIDGKITWPTGWSGFCDRQATEAELTKWAVRYDGVALCCGYGDLLAIDVDTDDPYIDAGVLKALPQCRVGRIGSKGFALLVRYHGERIPSIYPPDESIKEPLVEFKGYGANITVPPSLHAKTGKRYLWLNPDTDERIELPPLNELPLIAPADIKRVQEALARYSRPPRKRVSASNGASAPVTVAGDKRIAAYFKAGFESETNALAALKEGRPTEFFKSVCRLGWGVHHGVISKQDFTRGFMDACDRNGLLAREGARAIGATIDSGLDRSAKDALPVLQDRQEPVMEIHVGKGLRLIDNDDNVQSAELKDKQTPFLKLGDASAGIEGMLSDGTLKEMFVERHKDDLRHVASQGKWYRYDGKRWIPDDKKSYLDAGWRLCRDVAQRCIDSGQDRLIKLARAIDSIKTVKATLELASADPRIAASADKWDTDPWLLNTPDGVIDLRTGKMRLQRPEDYLSKMTLVAPDPSMSTPVWDYFLNYTMCGDKEVIAYTQRVLGYCLTGSIREHALFFGWGPGRNGKGTLVNTAAKSMGDYAQTAPIETFTASKHAHHPTELARMQGARLVTASETEEGKRWDEAKIKWLTGGDMITARFMRGDFFEFRPQHKILIIGNHKPGIRTADEAMRSRFHLIPFNATVPKEKRDKMLEDKLEAELPGILAWLIEGCLEWQRIGLATPESITAATDEYLTGEDSFESWFRDCAGRDHKSVEPLKTVYASWKAWCDENGEFVESNKAFKKRLENKGFKTGKESLGVVVKGMSLTDAVDAPF